MTFKKEPYEKLIIETFEKFHDIKISLVGSFNEFELDSIIDIDLYIVVPILSFELMKEITTLVLKLHEELFPHESFFVETRRGPFKINPAEKRYSKQLHLLFEDSKSIRNLTLINYLIWHKYSWTIVGGKMNILCFTNDHLIDSAIFELNEFISSLRLKKIYYKTWQEGNTGLRLEKESKNIDSQWEATCLMNHIYHTSNLIIRFTLENLNKKIPSINYSGPLTKEGLDIYLNNMLLMLRNEKQGV